jgi:hypothetical protein
MHHQDDARAGIERSSKWYLNGSVVAGLDHHETNDVSRLAALVLVSDKPPI